MGLRMSNKYDEIRNTLKEFGIVDIADFSYHFLELYLGDVEELTPIRKLVDIENDRLNYDYTWE